MALEDLYNLGKRTRVIYEWGFFSGTKSRRFTEAPFDIIMAGGIQYLVPEDTIRARSQGNIDYAVQNDNVDDGFRLGRKDWYYSEDVVTIGEHEMGDYKGHPEDWKGMHKFSPI